MVSRFGWMVVVFLSGAATLEARPEVPIDVWLDADPAERIVDDAIALIQAFHSPELEVRGVSVLFGNGTLAEAKPIARDIVNRVGPVGMPVYAGAASADDFGKQTAAVEALADALRARPMTVVALGPLTTVGTVVRRFPELHGRIERIVMVAARRPGQRFTPDGKMVFCDCNFDADVPAARAILATKIPIVFAPWEVAKDTWIGDEDVTRLAKEGGMGRWVADHIRPGIRYDRQRIGIDRINPFDSMAVGWLTHPGQFEGMPVEVWIETMPNDQIGATGDKPYLLIRRAEPGDRAMTYLYDVAPGFKSDLLKRLLGRRGARGAVTPAIDMPRTVKEH